MPREPRRAPAWIRLLLAGVPMLLAATGCDWILEQLTGDDPVDGSSDPLPVLSIAAAQPVEEGGELAFRVTLSRASGATVTVRYRTEPGTARAGLDFEAMDDGTITLTPGERRQAIAVRTLPDQDEEGSETFTVRLTDPQNARLGTAMAKGTILGDDDTPERAVTIAPGVHRLGRLETVDDVDYYRVIVPASGAVIAATDRAPAANPGNAVVQIEHDGSRCHLADRGGQLAAGPPVVERHRDERGLGRGEYRLQVPVAVGGHDGDPAAGHRGAGQDGGQRVGALVEVRPGELLGSAHQGEIAGAGTSMPADQVGDPHRSCPPAPVAGRGSRGSPSNCSPITFLMTSDVPPAIELALDLRNP